MQVLLRNEFDAKLLKSHTKFRAFLEGLMLNTNKDDLRPTLDDCEIGIET